MVLFWVCPAKEPRNSEAGWKRLPEIAPQLSSEPPGSTPCRDVFRQDGLADQAGYLRIIHTLGLDSKRLKKPFRKPREQAIGFIAFSRLHTFFRAPKVVDTKFRGLTGFRGDSGFVIPMRIRHLWQVLVFKENLMSL
jgi:hypothetical protein